MKKPVLAVVSLVLIAASIAFILWRSTAPGHGLDLTRLETVIGQRLGEAFAGEVSGSGSVRIFAMAADDPVALAVADALEAAGKAAEIVDLGAAGVLMQSEQSRRDFDRRLAAYYQEQLGGAAGAVLLGPLPQRFTPPAGVPIAVISRDDSQVARLLSAGDIRVALVERPGVASIDAETPVQELFDQLYAVVTPDDMDILKQ